MKNLFSLLIVLFINLFSTYGQETEVEKHLLSKKFAEAKQALDSVIVRKDPFLICLALSNPDWLIRSYAGKALKQIADDNLVPCLVKALEKNQDILSGGSEARASQVELNIDLVDILVGIAKLPLDKKEKYEKIEIERIISESKQWYENRKLMN